jgi:hypothetical protein
MRRNLLVQYRGGGYDGCMWEWNFFAWDSAGKFLNIFTSGYYGVKTEQEAEALLNNPYTSKIYQYNLTTEVAIDEFQAENNASNVIGVVNMLNEKTDSKEYEFPRMWFICDDCEKRNFHGYGDGLRGDGGIHASYTEKLCEDCVIAREESDEN